MIGRAILAVFLVLAVAGCGQRDIPASPAAFASPPAIPAGGSLVATASAASTATVSLKAGVQYEVLPAPQPTETGRNLEVVEFFWYACPHCFALQGPLHEWLKHKPPDVELRRIPAVLDSSWLQLARTYYTIDAMGLTGKLHQAVFNAIHLEKALDPRFLARDPKPLFDWVASRGVDRKRFVDTYNSFSVNSRTQRAADLSKLYDVPYTPVLVVDGRYLTSPSMKGNGAPGGGLDYARFFKNLDELIAMARNRHRAERR